MQGYIPAQSGSRKVLAVAFLFSLAYSIHQELGFIAIGIDLDHFLFAFLTPAHGPGMAINMCHGFAGPV
jgi:hypothetical protein